MASPSSVPVKRLGVRARRIGGALNLASVEGDVFELSEVATHIWDACDGTATVSEIAATVAQEFDVDDDDALADTLAFVAELEEAALLDVR